MSGNPFDDDKLYSSGYSRIGETYYFDLEVEMLAAANELEEEGFKVQREMSQDDGSFSVCVLGYR